MFPDIFRILCQMEAVNLILVARSTAKLMYEHFSKAGECIVVDEATDYVYSYVEDDTCGKCGRRDALSRLSLFRASC